MAGSGITFLRAHDADIPIPAAGKVTVYFSIEQLGPAYKDDAGLIFPLEGPTGAQGPEGVPGFAEDGLEGESYPIVAVGPQGNQGLQGPEGPMGQTIIQSDSFPDEMPFIPGSTIPFDVGLIQVVKLNITDAEYRALSTVPKTIPTQVPGSNEFIYPLRIAVVYELTSTFSANSTFAIRPVSGAAFTTTLPALGVTTNATTGKKMSVSAPTVLLTAFNLSTGVMLGVRWEVIGSLVPTGGSTTNGFNLYMWYSVLALP